MNTRSWALLATFVLSLACTPARANSVLFDWLTYYNSTTGTLSTSGTPDQEMTGTVTFSTVADSTYGPSNYDLVITLVNQAPVASPASAYLLDGLYWNMTQGSTVSLASGTSPGSLTMFSATASTFIMVNAAGNGTSTGAGGSICGPGAKGTTTIADTCTTKITGGWDEVYSTAAGGIGSAGTGTNKPTQNWGIGTTGQGGVFNGNDVNPFNYALTSANGVFASNADKSTTFAVSTAVFRFEGLSSSQIFIQQVAAAYGTAPEAVTNTTLVSGESPEPSTVVLIAGALVLLLSRKRRRV